MADKLIFPIGFDLEAAVKKAGDDWEKKYAKQLESIIAKRPFEIKAEIKGFDELGKSIDALNQNFAKLTAMLTSYNREATVAQQEVTNSVEAQGQAIANTTNTIQRQLMVQERVNKTLRDSYTEQERIKTLLDQYHDTYEEQVRSLAQLNYRLSENKKAQSENEKALKSGSTTFAEYNARQVELISQQRLLTQQKSELTQIMRAEEKAMLAQEGSYDQLSQQLSLLKRAYKELNDEGRTSPFGQELENAIQNLDANLKDMGADIGEFQRNVGNYAIAGQNGVVATESLTAVLNQQARTTQDLIDQTRILEEAKRMLDTNDANYASTLETINSKLEENKRKLSDISDILGKDAKNVAEAEAQNKRLSEALKLVDLTSADAQKRLEEIRAQIERNNKTIADATNSNEKYVESLLGLVGINVNLGKSLQELAQGGSLFDGLKTKVQAFGKTLIGLLSNPAVLSFLGIAGVVAGFKWWYNYNKGLIEASRLTENFTGLSGEAADKATADMQALADHMGQGYDKTISAANALVQQFGASWKEAMQLMEDGITAGADMSGNMVSNIERFAPALRDAGVSADEFMSILAETRNGIFNEQGIQLIVKAGGRLKAMTKQMAASLDAAGISSKQLQKDLTDGSITMFEAVQKVATKLKELPENSQEAGNIMKNVFSRTAAEGGTLLIQSIADVNTNLDTAKERMGELGKANEAQMNAQKELNEALSAVFKISGTNFEVMTTRAKTFVTQGLTKIIRGCVDIVNWFIRIYNQSLVVRGAINNQIAAIENVWAIAKYTLKNVFDTLKSVGKVLEGVFTLDPKKIAQGWEEGMAAIGNNTMKAAKKIASNTANAYNNTLKGELKEISVDLSEEGVDSKANRKTPSGTSNKFQPIDTADKKAAETYLQTLNKIEQSLSSIYAKYGDLEKKEGATKALEHINELYKTQLAYINELGKQFGLSFKMPTAFKDLQSYRSAILGVITQLKASGIKGADTAALELEMKIGTGNIDDAQKKIEEQLKTLSDKISRTKTAREFYDRILSQTGDAQMAATLTMNVYGEGGEDLFNNTVSLLQEYFSGVEVDLPINFDTQQIDYKALRQIWEADKALPADMRKIPEAYDSAIKQMLDSADNANQKMIEGWLKATEKAKTYSDKLLELSRTTQTEISRIEKESASTQLELANLLAIEEPTEEQQKRIEALRDMLGVYAGLIDDFKAKQAKEQTALAYEAFKDSPMYVQLFGDLEHASTKMLTTMRDRLESLKGEWKNLDPTQLKEMQSRLREIDEQLTSRNPFKALVKGLKDYRKLRTQGDDILKTKSSKEADKKLLEATDKRIEAELEYKKILEDEKATKEQVADAKDKFDKAQSNEKAAQKAKEVWQNVKIEIGSATDIILGGLSAIGDIASGVADIMESLGADEEDVTYWRTIGDSMGSITAGIQDVVQSIMKGDLMGVIKGVITAIPKMFVGFVNLFNAGKIRNANKEIKKQAELLERLQYTYSRLEKAAEKVFGAEYIANYNQQLKILNAQAEAYRKQAEAEKSKGKKADKDKIKEYENAARDTINEIADMETKLSEKFLGTDLTSAARDFAKAWLDAYKEFGNTADKMSEKFREMIENMVVESLLAKAMQKALEPTFKMIDEMQEGDFYNKDFWKGVMEEAKKGAAAADASGKVIMQWAKDSFGYDPRETASDLTGIKRTIGGASEETMGEVAMIGNTVMYYVSPIPTISTNVAAIRQVLENGVTAPIASSASGEWTDWQQQAMENYIAIQRNTADTAVECRRAAEAAEAAVSQLKRVITNNPSNTSYGVKVFA